MLPEVNPAMCMTLASSDVTKLPGDYPLDVMLHPSVCAGDKGLALMKALVRQFHRNGGSVIQFDEGVVSHEPAALP